METGSGIAQERLADPSAAWRDARSWAGGGLRREVFFFRSRGVELFASLYAPEAAEAPVGVLFCDSWGFEGALNTRLLYPLALSVAEAGGAALVFHYPGFGDSGGDLGSATLDGLAESAVDALREFARRQPCRGWAVAGVMLGASVACLAADRHPGLERLLLVQPTLRPSLYLARLERAARRSLGGPRGGGFALGYPLPRAMLGSAGEADATVAAALARYRGEGTIVRHAVPAEIDAAPERFEQICVEGAWRFGSQDRRALLGASSRHLRQLVAAAR